VYDDVLIEDPGAALRAMESLAVSTLKGLAKQLVQQQLLLAARLLTSLVYKPEPCTPKLTRAEWRKRRDEGREAALQRGLYYSPPDSLTFRGGSVRHSHWLVMNSFSRYGALP
jgi:hypothetical protein